MKGAINSCSGNSHPCDLHPVTYEWTCANGTITMTSNSYLMFPCQGAIIGDELIAGGHHYYKYRYTRLIFFN